MPATKQSKNSLTSIESYEEKQELIIFYKSYLKYIKKLIENSSSETSENSIFDLKKISGNISLELFLQSNVFILFQEFCHISNAGLRLLSVHCASLTDYWVHRVQKLNVSPPRLETFTRLSALPCWYRPKISMTFITTTLITLVCVGLACKNSTF